MGHWTFIYGRSVTSVFVPNGSAGPDPTLTTSAATTEESQNRNSLVLHSLSRPRFA